MGEFLGTVVSSSGESAAKGTWLLFFFKARRIPNLRISQQQGMTLRGTEAVPLLPGSGPKC